MTAFYRFIFDLLTSPFGLPVSPIWEYLILVIIGVVAYNAGWAVSEGGKLGSFVHWIVRAVVFIGLWAIVYGVIALFGWIIRHWVVILFVVGGIAAVTGITILVIFFAKKRKAQPIA